jgi:hypothetical protein
LLAGIRLVLKLKSGLAGATLMPEIAQIEDVALLQTIGDAIELASTPDEVRQVYHRRAFELKQKPQSRFNRKSRMPSVNCSGQRSSISSAASIL